MGLLDELLKAQKPKRNLMDTQMVKGPDQPYLRQDYPTVYGALGGLLATAPDVMDGSVLDPNTAAVRQGAEYTFPIGTALGVLPAARLTKGLPVGMGIKDVGKSNINVQLNKGSNFLSAKSQFGQVGGTIRQPDRLSDVPYLQINYAEVEKASRGKGKGKELYQALIDEANARGLRIFSDSTVEKPAVNVYKSLEKGGYKLKDMTSGSLEDGTVYGSGANKPAFEISAPKQSTYPQQAALDLAQQRAALPVSKGGLGLPANNTPEQRAAAMGFDVPAYHGTNANVPVFDISKNITAKDIYSSPNPSEASAYATREGGNVMPLLLRGKVKDLTTESQYVDNQLRKAYNAQVSKYERQYYPFEQFKESFMRGQLYQDTGGQSAQNALVGELIGNRKSILKIPDAVSDFGVGESYVMQNPDQIRSRFAAFDPFRRSAAIAATMGVAAPDLLASPIDEEELRRLQSGLLYAP